MDVRRQSAGLTVHGKASAFFLANVCLVNGYVNGLYGFLGFDDFLIYLSRIYSDNQILVMASVILFAGVFLLDIFSGISLIGGVMKSSKALVRVTLMSQLLKFLLVLITALLVNILAEPDDFVAVYNTYIGFHFLGTLSAMKLLYYIYNRLANSGRRRERRS